MAAIQISPKLPVLSRWQGIITSKVDMALPPLSRRFLVFSDLYITPPNAMKDTALPAYSWPSISDTQVAMVERCDIQPGFCQTPSSNQVQAYVLD